LESRRGPGLRRRCSRQPATPGSRSRPWTPAGECWGRAGWSERLSCHGGGGAEEPAVAAERPDGEIGRGARDPKLGFEGGLGELADRDERGWARAGKD